MFSTDTGSTGGATVSFVLVPSSVVGAALATGITCSGVFSGTATTSTFTLATLGASATTGFWGSVGVTSSEPGAKLGIASFGIALSTTGTSEATGATAGASGVLSAIGVTAGISGTASATGVSWATFGTTGATWLTGSIVFSGTATASEVGGTSSTITLAMFGVSATTGFWGSVGVTSSEPEAKLGIASFDIALSTADISGATFEIPCDSKAFGASEITGLTGSGIFWLSIGISGVGWITGVAGVPLAKAGKSGTISEFGWITGGTIGEASFKGLDSTFMLFIIGITGSGFIVVGCTGVALIVIGSAEDGTIFSLNCFGAIVGISCSSSIIVFPTIFVISSSLVEPPTKISSGLTFKAICCSTIGLGLSIKAAVSSTAGIISVAFWRSKSILELSSVFKEGSITGAIVPLSLIVWAGNGSWTTGVGATILELSIGVGAGCWIKSAGVALKILSKLGTWASTGAWGTWLKAGAVCDSIKGLFSNILVVLIPTWIFDVAGSWGIIGVIGAGVFTEVTTFNSGVITGWGFWPFVIGCTSGTAGTSGAIAGTGEPKFPWLSWFTTGGCGGATGVTSTFCCGGTGVLLVAVSLFSFFLNISSIPMGITSLSLFLLFYIIIT